MRNKLSTKRRSKRVSRTSNKPESVHEEIFPFPFPHPPQSNTISSALTLHSPSHDSLAKLHSPVDRAPHDRVPHPMAFSFPSTSSAAGELIMAALLTLPSPSFSSLARSLSSVLALHRRRLTFLLLSPLHFSLTLSHLRSLSFPQKTLLLARHLLSSLQSLLPSLSPAPSPHLPRPLRLRDLDAALLLSAMCDSYDPNTHRSDWRSTIADHLARLALSPAGLGGGEWVAVAHHVDAAAKCRRLMGILGGAEAGAAVAAVVALPSVEGGGGECVVCKEEMSRRREVCEMPCGHRFHWGCAMGWLRRRNTCPCCRYEMPTEDVVGEMGRVWKAMGKLVGRQIMHDMR